MSSSQNIVSNTIDESKNNNHNNIKYLDIVQINPEQFNSNQKAKQDEYIKINGQNSFYMNILRKKIHHPLKSHKTFDFRLTEEELNKLKEKKILFKNQAKTFADAYYTLYNNDLPVMITSDSILHPLHKYYDDLLMGIESNKLIPLIIDLCKTLLDNLYSITPTEINKEYLSHMELFFMIPYIILNLNGEISSDFKSLSTEIKNMFPDGLIKGIYYYENKRKNHEMEELEGYPKVNLNNKEISVEESEKEHNNMINSAKFIDFMKLHNLTGYFDKYRYAAIIQKSPKYNYYYNKFQTKDINVDVKFKYCSETEVYDILRKILNNYEISFNFCGVDINMDGTLFKPRGHYTKTFQLKQYFMAFSWLSCFDITIKKDKDNNDNYNHNSLIASSLISIISENCIDKISEFENFIGKIIGSSDCETITSFIKLIKNCIRYCKT